MNNITVYYKGEVELSSVTYQASKVQITNNHLVVFGNLGTKKNQTIACFAPGAWTYYEVTPVEV